MTSGFKRALLIVLSAFLAAGCTTHPRPDPKAQEALNEIRSLYRHLGIHRWSRPLSRQRGSGYRLAQIVYILNDSEEIVAELSLGSNVRQDGRIEVLIQEDGDGFVTFSLAFVVGSSSSSMRGVLVDRKFRYHPGSFGFGDREEEWAEVKLLKAGGPQGASSDLNDPRNVEKVILRFVE